MFERFTDRARRVIVRAQDEARGLQHNYIGTEHLLLGLLDARTAKPGGSWDDSGSSLPATREDVIAAVGAGRDAPAGRIPFTPRAKKALELALREALSLQHNYIGTEHLLLGVARGGRRSGRAEHPRAAHGADIAAVRAAVLDLLPAAQTSTGHRWCWPRCRSRPRASARPWLSWRPRTPAARPAWPRRPGWPGDTPSVHITCCSPPSLTRTPPRPGRSPRLGSIWSRHGKRCAVRTSPIPATSSRGKRAAPDVIRAAGGTLTIEAADPALASLARAAADALAVKPGKPGPSRAACRKA